MRGKLIVLEGIDGAGGETQSKLLMNFLEASGKNVLYITYPDYTGPIGRVIHAFLHKEVDYPADVQFSLYATDMVKDRDKINKALNEGRYVIANRYVTTTLAYQGALGFPIEKGLKFAKFFKLPVADLVIYLDISTKTSLKRKSGEKPSLDKFESDKEFLEKVRKNYLSMAKEKIFAKEWIKVNGEKSIENVAKEIQKIVLKKL